MHQLLLYGTVHRPNLHVGGCTAIRGGIALRSILLPRKEAATVGVGCTRCHGQLALQCTATSVQRFIKILK